MPRYSDLIPPVPAPEGPAPEEPDEDEDPDLELVTDEEMPELELAMGEEPEEKLPVLEIVTAEEPEDAEPEDEEPEDDESEDESEDEESEYTPGLVIKNGDKLANKATGMAGISAFDSSIDGNGNINITLTIKSAAWTCCVCSEQIVGDIVSCEHNHSLCANCVTGMTQSGDLRCPMCRSTTRGRNHIIEQAIKQCQIECKNQRCDHVTFYGAMEDHAKQCKYTPVNCPWCDEQTTPHDLVVHAEFECTTSFEAASVGNNLTFIKSGKRTSQIIRSNKEADATLYVTKSKDAYTFTCIQYIEDAQFITLRTTTSLGRHNTDTIQHVGTIKIPINNINSLIVGELCTVSIPRTLVDSWTSIHTDGLYDKWGIGTRWLCMDVQKKWYRATVIRSMVSEGGRGIWVKFDTFSERYNEWIHPLIEPERISEMSNAGKTITLAPHPNGHRAMFTNGRHRNERIERNERNDRNEPYDDSGEDNEELQRVLALSLDMV
jgi:hypothetical protein